MTTTDQNVSNLIINKLTKAQYDEATKSDTELYLTTDELISSSDVTTALGYTPADNDLSNLSNAGEEKLGSFIKYELVPQSDGFETVWNEAHSTFDSSKFTVVGGSTITDAGLVTDTAVWDKYVQIPINKLDVTSPFEVNFRVIKNTFTSNNQLIGGGSSSSNITIYASGSRYGDCRVRVYDSNTAQSSEVRVVSSWDDVQAIPDDTSVDVNISWDGTNYYYKVTNVSNGTVYANTSATSDLPLDTINYNNIIGNFVTSSGCYFDLKNTYIIQGGVIVFSGNITGTDTYTIDNATVSIPYALSTKDDKYVDSGYRNKVNALLVSQGYTPYYTVDAVNKNFTIPVGKLFKRIEEINDRGYELATESFAKVQNEAYSTFDSTKFTLVGSPTLTSNGILSNLSTSYYATLNSTLTLGTDFEIDFSFTTGDDITSMQSPCDGAYNQYLGLRVNNSKVQLYAGNGTYWVVGGPVGVTTLTTNTTYYNKVIRKGDSITWYLSADKINWSTEINVTTTLSIPSCLLRFGITRDGVASFDGSVDLKQFRIWINNKPVFNGNQSGTDSYVINGENISIPYTLSYNNDKYVDSYYRSQVTKILHDKGYTEYYTVDEANRNFTIPIGKLYEKVVTDLNGKADTDLTNVTNVGNIKMANASMPSSRKIQLTTGASGTAYIAPADGYLFAECTLTQGGWIIVTNDTLRGYETSVPGTVGGACEWVPIRKGSTGYVHYVNASSLTVWFIYAVGSESEAQ